MSYDKFLQVLLNQTTEMARDIADTTYNLLEDDRIEDIPPVTISFNGNKIEIPIDTADLNNGVSDAMAIIIEAIKTDLE